MEKDFRAEIGALVQDRKQAVSYRITCNNGNQRTLINS